MNTQTIFLTMVRSPKGKACVRLLIDSIRTFGGDLSDCPIWLFEANPQRAPCRDLASDNVRVTPLNVPDALGNYLFADKVSACAQAEAMATQDTQSLIWIDANCVVVNPPLLFDLGDKFDAAVRPVHIRNVGALTTEPLDEYWQTIYRTIGVEDIAQTVESFVDRQYLRAYFNTHAFAINPHRRLLVRWRDKFESLVRDRNFQARACSDEPHQIFLHQAILSALVATTLDSQRIRILPPTYNYPYNFHARVPLEHRAKSLNDLVCFTYEDRSVNPSEMTDIDIREPLKSWLVAHQEAE